MQEAFADITVSKNNRLNKSAYDVKSVDLVWTSVHVTMNSGGTARFFSIPNIYIGFGDFYNNHNCGGNKW